MTLLLQSIFGADTLISTKNFFLPFEQLLFSKLCHDMVEGGVVLLDAGFALGKNCRATAQAHHQPITHLVIKLIAEEQLLEGRHLHGDGVLVGEGGDCAKHFPRRDRVRWIL